MSAPANAAESAKAGDNSQQNQQQKQQTGEAGQALPQLSALEDDDEFEEFAAEDWEDDATGAEPKGTSTVLWEDNWDEADQEDTFTEQLRTAIKNPNSSSQPMQS